MTNKQASAFVEAIKIIVELSDSTEHAIQHIERIQNQLKENSVPNRTQTQDATN